LIEISIVQSQPDPDKIVMLFFELITASCEMTTFTLSISFFFEDTIF